MPAHKRQPHVQFRLDVETFALLHERVAELRAEGTNTSVDLYCRALVMAALGQPANVAFADEVAMRAHAGKNRVALYIGRLIEENMEEIVRQAGLTGGEDE